MLWSTFQIGLLVYLALMALIYFKQSSLVFLPEIDHDFRASPADIGLPFTPLKLATADGETLDGWLVPTPNERRAALWFFSTAMPEISATGLTICACSMILD